MVDRLTRQVAELTDVPGTVRIYRRIVALAELYADEAGARRPRSRSRSPRTSWPAWPACTCG
jgi:hypothetical protein